MPGDRDAGEQDRAPLGRRYGTIAGFHRRDLLDRLTRFTPTRLSRQPRRLLHIGLRKRVIGTYRYYRIKPGRAAVAEVARLTEVAIIPGII